MLITLVVVQYNSIVVLQQQYYLVARSNSSVFCNQLRFRMIFKNRPPPLPTVQIIDDDPFLAYRLMVFQTQANKDIDLQMCILSLYFGYRLIEFYSGSSPVRAIHMKQICSGKRVKKRFVLIMSYVAQAIQYCHAALKIYFTNE